MKKFLPKSAIMNQLSGAAIALIAVCSFSFISPVSHNLEPLGEEPGGGKSITPIEAKQLMANLPKLKLTVPKKGGYLSKTAIDSVFASSREATGLFWYVGTDANGDDLLLIIESGVSARNHVNTDARTNIFVSETMCPTECGSLGQ